LKPPLAELLEPVQDVARDPVMDLFPDPVDDVYVRGVFFAVEVETHDKKQLSMFVLAQIGDGRPDIHAINPDGIAPAGLIQQIPNG
jgi:hypothetical protein